MRKIEINFTNKWLYTLALFIGIFALGVGVYAYNSGGPASVIGHSTDELEGVCLTDGTGCPSGTVDTRCDVSGTCTQVCIGTDCQTVWPSGGSLDLSVDADGYLCYDTGASCTTSSRTCEPKTETIEERVVGKSCSDLQDVERNILCEVACSGTVACLGNSQGTCFGGSGNNVLYTTGYEAGCLDYGGNAYLDCDCRLMSGVTYSQEFAGGTRCI